MSQNYCIFTCDINNYYTMIKVKNKKTMKREFNFYKSWYAGFRFKDLIPCFGFSKNVQGWSFTRNWTLNWFTYCLQFSIVLRSDLNEDRNIAHEKNVARYKLK